MKTYQALIHSGGPALWPEHKPLAEVLSLRDSTPELDWEATYQGNPTPASGYTYRREWWEGKNRFAPDGRDLRGLVVARFQSLDTAEEEGASNAWTVDITAEILKDYRLAIRHVYRARMTFDMLPATIESMARQWNGDGLLRQVIIEDKSTGKSAVHTLRATAPAWLRGMIYPFKPQGSKETRAAAASVWCRNGMVLLPHPPEGAEWLLDFEDELFSFPQSAYMDQVDACSQLILYLENYLAEGWRARGGGR